MANNKHAKQHRTTFSHGWERRFLKVIESQCMSASGFLRESAKKEIIRYEEKLKQPTTQQS